VVGNVVVAERRELTRRAADWLAQEIGKAIGARGGCAIALSGGETPRPVYRELSAAPRIDRVQWNRVHVYFVDERAVPPDDPASNYRTARETLLERVAIPASQIHRMEAERPDVNAAAAEYEQLLPAALDILVLGMGSDGHTASLFPESPALGERVRRVVHAQSPTPPVNRLTITPPVIATARLIVVLVTGSEKAPQVAKVLRGPVNPELLPAQLARPGTWFVDTDAAALLGPPFSDQ